MRKLIKNVWQMMMLDRLFSGIYIFGTALALATCTTFAVLIWLKVAPVYPERERSRTAYVSTVEMRSTSGRSMSQSRMTYELVSDLFYCLDDTEEVSAAFDDWSTHFAQSAIGEADIEARKKPVDPAFFRIYDFDFLAGAPFSQEDFDSGLKVAVVSDRFARKVFGAVEPATLVGRYISLDFDDYLIRGVVREGTTNEVWSYGNVFTPYTAIKDYNTDRIGGPRFVGNFKVTLLTDNLPAVKAQVDDYVARYNSSQSDWQLSLWAQPIPHEWMALNDDPFEFSLWEYIGTTVGLIFILLLVPALNLSGIIAGRMESRLPEMGVRKSFGAGRGRLLGQVLAENFVLTSIGAIIGLACAYAALKGGVTELFANGDNTGGEITNEMIINPAIVGFLLLTTFLLNMLSALVPAWRSLRRPIVDSLKDK